jgi:hypothetical protein
LNGHAVDKRAARSATILDAALELDAARRAPKPKRTGGLARTVRAQREQTAAILARIKDAGPMTAQAISAAAGRRVGVTPLVNAGYLKAVGDKFKRTAKPFSVNRIGAVAK